MLPRKNPKSLCAHQVSSSPCFSPFEAILIRACFSQDALATTPLRQQILNFLGKTNPLLKAPTGLRAGSGETSCNLRAEVWKLRTAGRVELTRRMAGERILDAIVVGFVFYYGLWRKNLGVERSRGLV